MHLKSHLIVLYLNFVNDYLTVEKFAADHDFSHNEASQLLTIGKRLHEENADHFRTTGKLLYPTEVKLDH